MMIEHTRPSARALVLGLPNIAARVFNTPLLITPDKLQAVLWALSQRMDLSVEAPADSGVMRPAAAVGRWETRDRERGSGMLIDGGVGILPITGTLVHRGTWIGTSSGLQSYDGIAQQLRMAAEDERVKAVLLDLNTYGGEAGGVADLAAEIRELSAIKPVDALINDAAASAGYWMAAAARRVHITETGIAGSVGVVLTLQDITEAAAKAGVKITQIHAGAHKLLGSPFKALTDEERDQLQASVDQLYDLFTARVDSYRAEAGARLDSRKTEARIYRGAEAVKAGLADRVTTGRALLAEMQAEVANRGTRRTARSSNMNSDKGQGGADAVYTEQQMVAAKADRYDAGKRDGAKESASAERARVKTILASEHAKGREEMAQHLAFDTDLSADQATALLSKSPKSEARQAKIGRLDKAIAANGGSPNVGAEDGDGGEGETAEAIAKRIAAY